MAKRADSNQPEIVDALRAAGAEVQHLHAVGNGCPDLLVAYHGRWYVLEVKDGARPPSHRRLTPREYDWHVRFTPCAPVYVVLSAEQALRVIGASP
jgi:hypothetical protein